MTYLGDIATGRDNNLNLIRALAAALVLVSHAWLIVYGKGAIEPLQLETGHTLGTFSVYAFFVISGYLITMSFQRSSSWVSFAVARALRLMPGLLVSILLVALVLGPMVTSLGTGVYLTHPETWMFLIRNASLVSMQYDLPGVFADNPYPSIESSIWTLIYEVYCYLGVFVLGLLGVLRRRMRVALVLAAYLVFWFWVEVNGTSWMRLDNIQRLSLPFAIGMAFYVWRAWIPVTVWAIPLLFAATWAVAATVLYDFVLMVALSYAVFWLAYVPGGRVRGYNRIGDYSYGIYIYAFPFQGLAIWLFGDQSPLENVLYAAVPTLILSVLSWHLVEAPAMARKGALVGWVTRWLPARLLPA